MKYTVNKYYDIVSANSVIVENEIETYSKIPIILLFYEFNQLHKFLSCFTI
jgi:hypothetical protein